MLFLLVGLLGGFSHLFDGIIGELHTVSLFIFARAGGGALSQLGGDYGRDVLCFNN